MKKNNIAGILPAMLFCLFISSTLYAQKNYVSFEGGYFYGNAEKQLNSQMEASGFGDMVSHEAYTGDWFFPLLSILFGGYSTTTVYEDYPKSSKGNGNFWVRYGRELKNRKFVELGFGKIHSGAITGFDKFENTETFDGNVLSYKTDVFALTAHYMFSTKEKSAGIGAGPALAFNKITRYANNETDNKTMLQPGLSSTAYWRFINGEVFFMALRTDALFFVPATIDEVTLTSPKGNESTFQGAKVNSFTGDITVSVGLKF